jgi:DNA gyrase inhibitor GyrI
MSDATAPLSMEVRDLAPVRVAYIEFTGDVAEGEHSHEIGGCFQQVRRWIANLGHDPNALLHIGIAEEEEGRPTGYACCVQVPDDVESGAGDIGIQELVGGRYAVLTTDKDPSICGPIIGRFYQEYVPQKGIEIDDSRPTYEIYYECTMAYCVPIV